MGHHADHSTRLSQEVPHGLPRHPCCIRCRDGTALMLGWSRAWRCGRARRPSPPTPRPSRPEATGESEGTNDHRRTLDASPHASGRPSHSAFDGGGPLQARTRPRRTGERPSMGVTIGTDSRPLVETKITGNDACDPIELRSAASASSLGPMRTLEPHLHGIPPPMLVHRTTRPQRVRGAICTIFHANLT